MKFQPHPYQRHAADHVVDNPACGLFLEMGLGKTAATLIACDRLLYDSFEVKKILVIAPLRVAQNVWTSERDKWDELKHLRISKILGSVIDRKQALKQKAEIYVINRENLAWLIAHYGAGFPFDMVVIDELSSFKNSQSVRFKALRRIRPLIKRVVGLTGTPAPNSLLDLWPQLYLLDQGERLGKTLTGYRDRYFSAGARMGPVVYKYNINKGSTEEIYQKIGDICISMKAVDYLNLPKTVYKTVEVVLNPKARAMYDQFEKDQVMAILEQEITAVNAAALSNKLLQFANGALYDDDKKVHEVHSDKLEALEDLVEAANGEPVLIAYWYQHDRDRILKRLKSYNPVVLKTEKEIADWNKGKIPVMLLHPQSGGHGLNLQDGGAIIIWFAHTWSSELVKQFNARLDRQGQTRIVMNHRLVATGTMDEDVIQAQDRKAAGEDALMEAIKARIKKYTDHAR